MRHLARVIPTLALIALWHGRAQAEETKYAAVEASMAVSPAHDDRSERGRRAYLIGVAFAKKRKWGEALAAFEEAAALRDAPEIDFNIAYCARILGKYVAANQAIGRALRDPTGFDPVRWEDAKASHDEFERIIVRVKATLDPDSAKLVIDGRPLVPVAEGSDTFLAGVGPPGEGNPLGRSRFTILLDPGAHMLRVTRPGHQDLIVHKVYGAGEEATLDLHLDVLPAVIAVRSDPAGSIVRVGNREVGIAPVEVQRQAGRYEIEVVRDNGYEPYKATLDLEAGQRADITAKLVPYREPITRRWWFWTGAVAAVTGGVVLTYVLTRPSPEPPPYNGGSLHWVAQPGGIGW